MYRYSITSGQFEFRSDRPISNEILARHAPSIFTEEPCDSRSDKYQIVPTIDVLNVLRSDGFEPFEVRQTRARTKYASERTRHMVRLRHPDMVSAKGDTPEIILLNSHDGSSSFQLVAGFFRFICLNGMMLGDKAGEVRIRHTGNVVEEVLAGAHEILENLDMVYERVDQFRSISLNDEELGLFAQAVVGMRWGDRAPLRNTAEILMPRRYEDAGTSLWNALNCAQENLIKGGLRGGSSSGRRTTTRRVTGVNQDVALNRGVWSLADRVAEAKINQTSVEEALILEAA